MALAMMGGIIAATVLTLTFLPALYALSFGVSAHLRRNLAIPAAEKARRLCEILISV